MIIICSCKEIVKNVLSLYAQIQEKVSPKNPDSKEKFPTEESITIFKWNNYKALLSYIKSLSSKETDPNNPENKAKKTTRFLSNHLN